MRLLLLAVCFTFLALGCRQDNGEALFDLIYPPVEFTLPSGQPTFISNVKPFNYIPTKYTAVLTDNMVDPMDVNRILPFYARLVSLDGIELGFLSSVSIRVCPTTEQDCTLTDEVFFINDLFNRRITTIDIAPGLANVKDILSSDLYKLEVVLINAQTNVANVRFRLEYGFRAYK